MGQGASAEASKRTSIGSAQRTRPGRFSSPGHVSSMHASGSLSYTPPSTKSSASAATNVGPKSSAAQPAKNRYAPFIWQSAAKRSRSAEPLRDLNEDPAVVLGSGRGSVGGNRKGASRTQPSNRSSALPTNHKDDVLTTQGVPSSSSDPSSQNSRRRSTGGASSPGPGTGPRNAARGRAGIPQKVGQSAPAPVGSDSCLTSSFQVTAAAARRAAVEERLAAATDAVAEARGLLRRNLVSNTDAAVDQVGAAALEQSLARMMTNIEASLDIAVDAANKIGSSAASPAPANSPKLGPGQFPPQRPRRLSPASHQGAAEDMPKVKGTAPLTEESSRVPRAAGRSGTTPVSRSCTSPTTDARSPSPPMPNALRRSTTSAVPAAVPLKGVGARQLATTKTTALSGTASTVISSPHARILTPRM